MNFNAFIFTYEIYHNIEGVAVNIKYWGEFTLSQMVLLTVPFYFIKLHKSDILEVKKSPLKNIFLGNYLLLLENRKYLLNKYILKPKPFFFFLTAVKVKSY